MPIFAVDVPRQFIFAFFNVLPNLFNTENTSFRQVQFFVDPLNGMVYSQKDVEVYLKKINANDKDMYFAPILTKRIIYKMMEELCLCYRYRKEDIKADEIQELMKLLVPADE